MTTGPSRTSPSSNADGTAVDWQWLQYADDTAGEVDLAPLLNARMNARVRRDDDLFASVTVDAARPLAWPDGTEIAPELLYAAARPRLVAIGRSTPEG
jgi:hypothetical protein